MIDYKELDQVARTIRKRGWQTRTVELERLVKQRGVLAAFELGRIVGHMMLAEAVHLCVDDGWDPAAALRRSDVEPPLEATRTDETEPR